MNDIDQNWAWFVLLGAVLANLLSGGILYTFGVLYMDFMDRLDSSSAVTSAIGALSLACFYFIGPVGRLLTCYLGYRLTTIIGSSVQALGLLLSVLAPNVNFYFLTLGILSGCGGGIIYLACFAAVSDYFEKRLNLAIGLVYCSPAVGVFLFAIITHLALNTYAYYGTFILLSALMLNGIVCGCLFFPLRYKSKPHPDTKNVEMNDEHSDDQTEPITDTSIASNGDDDDPQTITKEDGEKKGFVKVKKHRYKAVEEIEQSFTFSADETSFKLPTVDVPENMEEYESEEEIEPEHDIEAVPDNESPVTVTDDVAPGPDVQSPNQALSDRNDNKPKESVSDMVLGVGHARELCHWSFFVFMLSLFFFSFGYSTPYFQLPDVLRSHGGDNLKAAGLLACIGIGATVGSVLSWTLACKIDRSYTGALLMLLGACISGLVIAFFRYYSVIFVVFFCAIGFGFFSAACVPPKIKIVTILHGETSLPGMAGWGSWALGLGAILGSPIAGYLRDDCGTYGWSFVSAGTALCACALVTFPLLFVHRERHRYIRDAI